ncbi:MAG: cell filamentation protein Fic [Comamonadaceae bacterium]|nr:cell filamentation protein Fic [Comamonadaceae bacterium]
MNVTALKKPTPLDGPLHVYSELTANEVRALQRRIAAGTAHRIVSGLVSTAPADEWPALVARERNRVLAGLFPGAVISFRSAFAGGAPVDGVIHLSYTYHRTVELPGLTVVLVKAAGRAVGDLPISGRELYFPSYPRLLLENLTTSRSLIQKQAGREAVEERLLTICDSRGEEYLLELRDQARELSAALDLEREFKVLDGLIGSILGTRSTHKLTSKAGKARSAAMPYDHRRLALFEKFAERLRTKPLPEVSSPVKTAIARQNFAFLESYFSNFIEGTEFGVEEARGFVLEGLPIETRPKDSHDVLGVFHQASDPGWANQTLAAGAPVLEQLRARHADQMKERPEVGPGQFKDRANRAGNTEFVLPREVRGTLVVGSQLLPTVPPGLARALLAMFVVAEVHPFNDGNGRLARLVMNAELSVAGACRIIVPTLFRDEYLDCLRVLTREGDCEPFVTAMTKIQAWSAAFVYDDLDKVLESLRACNAFEKSRTQYKLLTPTPAAAPAHRPSTA